MLRRLAAGTQLSWNLAVYAPLTDIESPKAESLEASRVRGPQQRLSHDHVQQLVTDYRAGATMTELAAHFGLHRTTVASHLRRAGIELCPQGVSHDKRGEAVRLNSEGWSLQRLGERYDCSADTVRRVLSKAGVTMRRPWERK